MKSILTCRRIKTSLYIISNIALILAAQTPAAETFRKVEGIDDTRIRSVVLSEDYPERMAVASDNTLYLSANSGTSFKKAMVLKDERISHLCISDSNEMTVYVAGTRNGYRATGSSSEKVFTANEDETIYFIHENNNSLYAGTSKGFYFSKRNLLNWQQIAGLRDDAVYSITTIGSDIYLSCGSGVYQYHPDGTLRRLFVARSTGGDEQLIPYLIRVDAMTSSRLWLCTSQGVFLSNDRGETWERFYITGTGNASAYCLVQFPLDGNHFYLCSDAGFHKINIENGNARPVFSGLPTSNINWADISASGDLYLATDRGLYEQQPAPAVNSTATQDGLAQIMTGEPSIHEVQEAAMRYNSVHPEKTGTWSRRLKYRALFPKLDIDYDKTIGSSFTSSGYYYAEGPNDWGVSLTWDIGNLIWNSYEDDVDNRTKLTTQLRLDILDEVNRLYFERLRLKYEIAHATPQSEDTILQQLRLYEITATLDGYTGGLFAQQM